MKNLIFIIVSLLCLTACQWNLDKFDLDGNIYDCEKTCVNGVCDELKNECICNKGWGGKDCDMEVVTFESILILKDVINEYGYISDFLEIEGFDITSDGGYIVTGTKGTNSIEVYFPFLMKIDKSGRLEWEKILNESIYPTSIMQVSGEYFISNYRSVLKLDQNGNSIWEKGYNGSISQIKSSNGENLLLFGHVRDSLRAGVSNVWISEIDINGEQIWEASNSISRSDRVSEALNDNSGFLIMNSTSYVENEILSLNGSADIILLKTDLVGETIWLKNYGGSDADIGRTLAKTFNNEYLVGGYSKSSDFDFSRNYGNYDALAMKIDSNKNILWQKNYGGSSSDYMLSIKTIDDLTYVFGGYTYSNDINVSYNYGSSDFWLVKIDLNGNIIWEKTYGSSGDEILSDMQVTPDGGFIMVGTKDGKDIYIVKTDANGNVQ